MTTLTADLGYAVRRLRRDRGVTAVIVAILTAGIASTAVMFGVVDRLLLQPPPGIGHPDDVRRLHFGSDAPEARGNVADRHAYPLVAAIRDRVAAFSGAAATSLAPVTIGAGAEARRATAQLVDASYFSVLELEPFAGTFFGRDVRTVSPAEPVAVLSHGFWQLAFGGDARVLGQRLRVEGAVLTIVGIGPAGFKGVEDRPVDLWVPTAVLAPTLLGGKWASNPGRYAFGLIARLAPGATPAVADQQATVALRAAVADAPPISRAGTAFTAPLDRLRAPDGVPAEGKVAFWLLGVSAAVLIVAVANVASLLLTRAWSRRRDVAVRLALGVTRGRLLKQELIESAILTALAAAAAVAVAYAGGRAVQQLLLPGFSWPDGVVDGRVLAATLAIATMTALAAGLAPAIQVMSGDPLTALRATPRGMSSRTGRLRTGLLVAQVALSVVLLVGAGLFVRSLIALGDHDVGVDLDRVAVALLPDRPGQPLVEIEGLYARAAQRIATLDGIERVAIARGSAPTAVSTATSTLRDGWTLSDLNGRAMPSFNVVGPEHFATLGASVERGRGFTSDDERLGAAVVVINRALADDFWPDVDPLGQCVRVGGFGEVCSTIVGIVENVLSYDRVNTSRSQLYLLPSHPRGVGARPRALIIRARNDAAALVPAARQAIQSLTPDMPFVEVETLEERTAPQLQPWRLGSAMFLLFGGIALVISAVGVFSAMAQAVSQRSLEIGIRMALGAPAWRVVVQIGRQGAAIIAAGTFLGLLAAAALSRWLGDLLFETSPRDPLVFVAVAGILAAAGVVAAVVPARRSAALDPLLVLKSE